MIDHVPQNRKNTNFIKGTLAFVVFFLLETASYAVDMALVDDQNADRGDLTAALLASEYLDSVKGAPRVENPFAMGREERVVVAGAGGFIGSALVRSLSCRGFQNIRAVDINPLGKWHQIIRSDLFSNVENLVLDLQEKEACDRACKDAVYVFNLAGRDVGESMLSALINNNMLMAARANNVKRFLFSPSAGLCDLAEEQACAESTTSAILKECDDYLAIPENGCELDMRIVHFYEVYGPYCSYDDGREETPAAICLKVVDARLSGLNSIEVSGDGSQTGSFMFIDDCLEGLIAVMESGIKEPVDLGSSGFVSINRLVDLVEEIGEVKLKRFHKVSVSNGMKQKNSADSLIRKRLGWGPSTSLYDGLVKTYEWIKWKRFVKFL